MLTTDSKLKMHLFFAAWGGWGIDSWTGQISQFLQFYPDNQLIVHLQVYAIISSTYSLW